MSSSEGDDGMTEKNWFTVQRLLDAISDLPGVRDRVEAYMLGCGVEDPARDIADLYAVAFYQEAQRQWPA